MENERKLIKKEETPNKKVSSNRKSSIKQIIYLSLIFLVAIGIFFGVNKFLTANAIKQIQEQEKLEESYNEWLAENCNCLEKLRYKCPVNFELNGDKCINETIKRYTYRLISCSKYDCSGEIRKFNFENNKWDIPEGFEDEN